MEPSSRNKRQHHTLPVRDHVRSAALQTPEYNQRRDRLAQSIRAIQQREREAGVYKAAKRRG